MHILRHFLVIFCASVALAAQSFPMEHFSAYQLAQSEEIWWQVVGDFHKCICLDAREMVLQLSLI